MLDPISALRDAIASTLGHGPGEVHPGKFMRFSTNGKRANPSGWCLMFEDMRAAVFGDFSAGISEVWTSTPRDRMTPAERNALRKQVSDAKAKRQADQREAWRRNDDRNRFIQRQAREVKDGDPVAQYLKVRVGVDASQVPACIRTHQALPYVHDGVVIGDWPCMLAPLVSPDGRLVAWHRTYLTPEGEKADVPGPVKKLSPAAGLVTGSSIRLYPPSDGAIGVAEGIETAMAAFLASGVPTVATYSAGNLAAYAWPRVVRRLVLFADADPAGEAAATELKARAIRAGLDVFVTAPTTPGLDWCDVWAARGAESLERQA